MLADVDQLAALVGSSRLVLPRLATSIGWPAAWWEGAGPLWEGAAWSFGRADPPLTGRGPGGRGVEI